MENASMLAVSRLSASQEFRRPSRLSTIAQIASASRLCEVGEPASRSASQVRRRLLALKPSMAYHLLRDGITAARGSCAILAATTSTPQICGAGECVDTAGLGGAHATTPRPSLLDVPDRLAEHGREHAHSPIIAHVLVRAYERLAAGEYNEAERLVLPYRGWPMAQTQHA